jgi:hypothetical protein
MDGPNAVLSVEVVNRGELDELFNNRLEVEVVRL